MSDLRNQTPSTTYKGLLQVNDYSNGVDATSKFVQDGEGTNSALAIGTTKVGIGTTSPSQELDVSGNVVADEYALDQTGTSSSAVAIHAPATNELAIRTNSTEAIRIDSSGNVGIGTTSPSANLEIFSAVKPIIRFDGTGNNAGQTNFGEIQFYNRDDSADGPNVAASIHAESASSDGAGGVLVFSTEDGGADSEGEVATPRMTIAADGKVGIGTVPSGYKLDVQGSTTSSANSSVANLHASAAGAEAVLLVKNDSATGEGARIALFNSNTGSYPNANKAALVLESATPALCVCFNTDAGTTQATFKFLSDSNAFFVANTSSVPSTPTGGGVMYVEGGALKYKGSSGTITTLGVA